MTVLIHAQWVRSSVAGLACKIVRIVLCVTTQPTVQLWWISVVNSGGSFCFYTLGWSFLLCFWLLMRLCYLPQQKTLTSPPFPPALRRWWCCFSLPQTTHCFGISAFSFFLCDCKLFFDCFAVFWAFIQWLSLGTSFFTHRFSVSSVSFIFLLCFYVGSDNEGLVYNSCRDWCPSGSRFHAEISPDSSQPAAWTDCQKLHWAH